MNEGNLVVSFGGADVQKLAVGALFRVERVVGPFLDVRMHSIHPRHPLRTIPPEKWVTGLYRAGETLRLKATMVRGVVADFPAYVALVEPELAKWRTRELVKRLRRSSLNRLDKKIGPLERWAAEVLSAKRAVWAEEQDVSEFASGTAVGLVLDSAHPGDFLVREFKTPTRGAATALTRAARLTEFSRTTSDRFVYGIITDPGAREIHIKQAVGDNRPGEGLLRPCGDRKSQVGFSVQCVPKAVLNEYEQAVAARPPAFEQLEYCLRRCKMIDADSQNFLQALDRVDQGLQDWKTIRSALRIANND